LWSFENNILFGEIGNMKRKHKKKFSSKQVLFNVSNWIKVSEIYKNIDIVVIVDDVVVDVDDDDVVVVYAAHLFASILSLIYWPQASAPSWLAVS